MKILTPATSANLGPGFDALGISIKLYNEVIITKQNFNSICINGEGSDRLNLKKNNIYINIFNEIISKLSDENLNFRFSFTNNIPFSRGLGSSSSVVVSAIGAAYHMAGFKVDKSTILNKSLKYENHPDNISPAVWGGFTSNIVHNNEVFTQKADISEDLRAVLVIPNKCMNTRHSRDKLPKTFSIKDTVSNIAHSSYLTACFIKKDYDNLRIASIDKMHEECRMQGLKELFLVRKLAYLNGALMSNLSGSGSTFFNLAYKEDSNSLKEILQRNFPDFKVEIYELDNDGFVIIQS